MKPIHILVILILLTGCKNQTETPPPAPTAQTYLKNHQYQEAIWAYRAQGDTARAKTILTTLKTILKSQPDSLKPWEGKGITRPYIVFFPNNVRGFFKQAGSDTGGSVKSEVASYQIDQLLGLDLMATTRLRNITLPNGKSVSGVITYFVQNAQTANTLKLRTADQPDKLIFFDAIIANADRHTGNWMIRNDTGEVFAIDHNRTFYHNLGWTWWDRVQKLTDDQTLRPYFNRFKNLPDETFQNALKDLISPEQYKAFQNARKTMIRYLDNKIN